MNAFSRLALLVGPPVMAVVALGIARPWEAGAMVNGVSADLRDAPIEDALKVVLPGDEREIIVDDGTAAKAKTVTLKITNRKPEDAARAVARAAGAPVKIEAKKVTVGPPEDEGDLRAPQLDTEVYGQTKFAPNANAALRVVTLRHEDASPVSGADVLLTLSRKATAGGAPVAGFARTVFRGKTDASGSVNAQFRMPVLAAGAYDLSITTAALRERDRVVRTISITPSSQVLLTTDKPVYQPGQMIHIRALALSAPDRTPVANTDATIEVMDGKGNKVFKNRARTSDYGITSADFQLADEVNMGAYKVRAIVGKETQEKTVTVDRYVLPKFKVEFKPDRSWYLPGETLSGVISAQYFFGKPVAGRVKVSLSSFDAGFNQFGEVSGTLDETGHFRLDQKLPAFFAGQPLEQGNAFVKADIVVTDTADHDEKATKSVAVAAQPIKVTLIPESGNAVAGAKNRIYVVTSYPDGAPARTKYDIRVQPAQGREIVREGSMTDDGGLGFVEYTAMPGALTLKATARDAEGRAGEGTTTVTGLDSDGVLLRADRALYRVGDRMYLTALSPAGRATIYFDILRDRQTVKTETADLKDGRADLAVDLGNDLTGTLEIHAYRIGKDGNIRRDTRVVYVDPADDLTIKASPDRETYTPGQGAKVRFAVTGPNGRPQPAALGVSIVDESVFALQEMQPGMEKVYFLLEKEILEPRYEIHGITPDEIVRPLPVHQAQPARQRAAGALFAALPRHDDRVVLLAATYGEKAQKVRERAYIRVAKVAESVRLAILAYKKAHGDVPSLSGDLLVRLARDGSLMGLQRLDPWGKPYTASAHSASYNDGFSLRSDGPDGKPNSGDEIEVWVNLNISVTDQLAWRSRTVGGFGGVAQGRGVLLGGMGRVDAVNGNWAFDEAMPMREMAAPMPVAAPAGKVMLDISNSALGLERKAAPAVRVREFFPETLLFQPSLITDNNGIATLDVPMADSITTWRLTAMGSSRGGGLGSVTAPMRAFQDFFVDINFPVRLTQGDEVAVPVSVYNYLNTAQNVTLTAEREGWFQTLDDGQRTVRLGPNEVKGVSFRIKVTGLGFQKLTVRAQGGTRADAVRREVEVVPNGKKVEQVWNGRITGGVHQTVKVPEGSVTGASNILVRVYPGLFSTVVDGMDKVFRMPFGCFEQTSSVTYPNLLVLDYMKRTKRITPEIQMKAEQYVNLGYQRLLSYEVQGGGFSWFGDAPANKVLTAYGLQEFADMSKVWEVDPAMITRTRAWEAGQQNADGSWTPDPNYIDEGLGPMWKSNLLSTAYVLWGMAESARAIEAANDAAVGKAVNYLKGHAGEAKDAYAMAVVANALVAAAPEDPATQQVIDRLLAEAITEGDLTYWKTGQATVTWAGGESANIETTGLAAFALIRSGQAPDVAGRALNWLISKRDPSGTWGTTQGTVLALKALVASLGAQVQKGTATVTVRVNGTDAGKIQVTPDNADVMQQVDCKPFVYAGDNEVELVVDGKGQMMYGISEYHYIPWDQVREEKGPLDITVKYDRTKLAKDETLTAAMSITFDPNRIPFPLGGLRLLPKAVNMVVVDLGIPPGFQVDTGDLKALVDNKTVQRYETTGRQVILYFEKIEANKPVNFDVRMRAQYPLRANSPQTVAYEYYRPESRATVAPVALEVTE